MFVPVNEPLLNGNEKKYLNECIETGWVSAEGAFISKFEDGMSKLTKRKYAITVTSGTVALEVAVRALNFEKGSEIIMPDFTIISCAQAIVRAGCVPVLVDCDPDTWNMNINQIEEKITNKTAAIMAVHIYGITVDMKPLIEIAEKYNLKVIEDAAEVIGQKIYNEPAGSFGDVSCFSFYSNKHVTTGEGGMIVCNDEKLAQRCKDLKNYCFAPERRFMHYELGHSYMMSNLQAAVGFAQLEKLEEHIIKKRYIGKKYQELLKDLSHKIILPLEKTSYCENIYWVFGIVLKDNAGMNAQECAEKLRKLGVGTRPFFWPMHEQPVFINEGMFKGEKYPISENIARMGFYIPSGLTLDDEKINYVSQKIHEVLN